MILWWVLLIAAIVFLVTWVVKQTSRGGGKHPSALDVLKERYARGEISKQEFEEKKRDIA